MQNGRLDFKKLKTQLGFEKLKMADRKKVEKQTGYLTGCISLVGLRNPCIIDKNYFAMILFMVLVRSLKP